MTIKIFLREEQVNESTECIETQKSNSCPEFIIKAVKKAAIKKALSCVDKLRVNDNAMVPNLIKNKVVSFLNNKIEEFGLKVEIDDVNIEKIEEGAFLVEIPVEGIDYGKTIIKLLPLLSEKARTEKHNKILRMINLISDEKKIKIINSVFEHLDDSDVESILLAVVENYNEKICGELSKLLKKTDLGYYVEKLTLEI